MDEKSPGTGRRQEEGGGSTVEEVGRSGGRGGEAASETVMPRRRQEAELEMVRKEAGEDLNEDIKGTEPVRCSGGQKPGDGQMMSEEEELYRNGLFFSLMFLLHQFSRGSRQSEGPVGVWRTSAAGCSVSGSSC